ncbi:MmcQ/YjbR family DNA-binding protein [Duffyella gerundensis]|uniref:MmcQ/YjbR family DNA-binding protein n=1 Tax=Duffyella gerundensis TaxID=1619313 RepID=UPI003FD61003
MTTSELLSYCMAKPGAEQQEHEALQATQVQADGVLFAMFHQVNVRPAVSLKSTPALADLLREEHEDVFPSQQLNKSHWSTLFLDGTLKDSQIYYLVDASLQQALATKGH